jgi:hypothetical protein
MSLNGCFGPPFDPSQTYCDDESPPIAGTVRINVDSLTSPTSVTLEELTVAWTEPAYFFVPNSAFAPFDVLNFTIGYANPGTPTPAAPLSAPNGGFFLHSTPFEASGFIQGGGLASWGFAFAETDLDTTFTVFTMFGFLAADAHTATLNLDFSVYIVYDHLPSHDPHLPGISLEILGSVHIRATAPLPTLCPADLTADGTVDSGDLALFINAFLAQDPLADITADGVIDSGDLAAFISDFLADCTP